MTDSQRQLWIALPVGLFGVGVILFWVLTVLPWAAGQ